MVCATSNAEANGKAMAKIRVEYPNLNTLGHTASGISVFMEPYGHFDQQKVVSIDNYLDACHYAYTKKGL
ncbi:hypothetical protein INT44_007523 [Umbelopsis vinacea]|uniref:Uncharacterized protein n=1 Tax=Umbelopsis vinacea TaxID=44442 RepID=A0A8H7UEX2_9FUNG|nr:hypothetical protein INT44_007523 [Umbelopsis vinacea]